MLKVGPFSAVNLIGGFRPRFVVSGLLLLSPQPRDVRVSTHVIKALLRYGVPKVRSLI